MAYCEYESYYQEDDYGEFNLYPQDGTFQFAQTLPSMAYFGHENSIYTLFQYDPPPYYSAYDSATTFSAARCSASTFSQPLLIQYDPNLYDSDFNPITTKFVVSYSVSELGEPEFEEFNPTPYAGGYDPAQTYGKSLPASSEICYPRSQAGPVSDQVSKGVTALPKEKEESFEHEVKPPNEGEKQKGKIEKEEEREKTNDGGENGGNREAVDENENVKVPQISHVPRGYGLEATDLCESLFGYWPCLSNMNGKRDERDDGCRDIHGDQWRSVAADYLFGSSDPYAEMTDDGRSSANPICSYDRHYQLQSYSGYA